MLKIAICDDEQVFLNEMEMILNNYLNEILYLIFDYQHKYYTFKYFEI